MSIGKDLNCENIVFYCDGCFSDVTNIVFLTCNDCDFDLCINCFHTKVETSIHRYNHRYRIIHNLNAKLLDDWSLLETLLLINGLLICGIGNFYEIALMIPNKTENDVKIKFFELTTVNNNTKNELSVGVVGMKSNPNDLNLVNYMPNRQEFEIEYYNDFEELLQQTFIETNDSDLVKNLKNHMFYYTKSVLKYRNIWKNFVIDRGIVKINNLFNKDQTEFGVFVVKYKWLAQVLSKHDFNLFVGLLYKEHQLNEELKQLSINEIVEIDKLMNLNDILSPKENIICKKLNIKPNMYVKIKRYVIEQFINKKSIKNKFFSFFKSKDYDRAEILYHWFCANGMII